MEAIFRESTLDQSPRLESRILTDEECNILGVPLGTPRGFWNVPATYAERYRMPIQVGPGLSYVPRSVDPARQVVAALPSETSLSQEYNDPEITTSYPLDLFFAKDENDSISASNLSGASNNELADHAPRAAGSTLICTRVLC